MKVLLCDKSDIPSFVCEGLTPSLTSGELALPRALHHLSFHQQHGAVLGAGMRNLPTKPA